MSYNDIKEFPKVSFALFDMDGTLLTTEDLYAQIYTLLFAKYGKMYTMEMRQHILGCRLDYIMKYFSGIINMAGVTPEVLTEEKKAIQESIFPTAQLLPGVEKLIRHLKAHHIPIAVATSSGAYEYNLKTKHHQEFFSLFDVVVKGDDPEVKQGKPHPDVFLVALKRLQPAASQCQTLVFEDSPNGVKAGHAAGMQVVAIPDGSISLDHFSKATLIINSMESFVPEQWGLPSFNSSNTSESAAIETV